MLEEFILSNHI